MSQHEDKRELIEATTVRAHRRRPTPARRHAARSPSCILRRGPDRL